MKIKKPHNKKRVVQIITDSNIGGAGKWLVNFLKSYNKDIIDMYVIIPKNSKLKDSLLNCKTICIDKIEDKSFDFSSVFKFYKCFKEIKPDIIHTHASLAARIAGRFYMKAKIVYSKHCIDSSYRHNFLWKIKKLFSSTLNNMLADAVIAVSVAVSENLVENGVKKEKIHVIYNGIERLNKLNHSYIRKEFNIGEDDILTGIVARLEPVKSHHTFLEAAHNISHFTNCKFLVVGTGSLESKLKEKAPSNVIFTGFRNDIEQIMNELDINVITSVSEALCISIIEGMSLGKPAVGSRVGGVPEIIKDNGLLFEAGNSSELTAALLKLIGDPDLRENMGKEGLKLYEKCFTSAVMANKIQELYESLTGGS